MQNINSYIKPRLYLFFSCGIIKEEGFGTLYFCLTICILLSFVIIAILYFSIWISVYKTDHDNRSTLQQQTLVNTRRLAFKLSLYVVVYIIQYGGVAVEGMLVSTTDMPKIVRIISLVGSMSGGIINGIVYEKLRRS